MGSGTFSTADGITIYYREWAATNPEGLVIFVHGLGEHGGRYGELASFLCDNGFACAAMDNRGHGKSTGRKGHINIFNDLASDLDTFINILSDENETRPLFILGHSLGGLITLYLIKNEMPNLDGVIVSAPPLELKVQVPQIKIWLGKFLSGFLPMLTLSNEIDPAMLSHDAEMVEKYETDPLVHNKISARMFTEMMGASDSVKDGGYNSTSPILLIQGEDDPIVDPEGTYRFFEKLGQENKELIKYPGFYHESLNEREREKVFKDISSWLRKTLKSKVSTKN